jgi:hypothetical protein
MMGASSQARLQNPSYSRTLRGLGSTHRPSKANVLLSIGAKYRKHLLLALSSEAPVVRLYCLTHAWAVGLGYAGHTRIFTSPRQGLSQQPVRYLAYHTNPSLLSTQMPQQSPLRRQVNTSTSAPLTRISTTKSQYCSWLPWCRSRDGAAGDQERLDGDRAHLPWRMPLMHHHSVRALNRPSSSPYPPLIECAGGY